MIDSNILKVIIFHYPVVNLNLEHVKCALILFTSRHSQAGWKEGPSRHLFRSSDFASPRSNAYDAFGNPEFLQRDLRVPLCDPATSRVRIEFPRIHQVM